jgi:hypothetical protein
LQSSFCERIHLRGEFASSGIFTSEITPSLIAKTPIKAEATIFQSFYNICSFFDLTRSDTGGMERANSRRMTLELVSVVSERRYFINPKALGKLLHMARLHGWQPERVPNQWPSETWETEIILPHLGPYMPGRVSREDANGLKSALTKAMATGAVAAEGNLQLAAGTLLQVARDGAFRVQLGRSEPVEPHTILG